MRKYFKSLCSVLLCFALLFQLASCNLKKSNPDTEAIDIPQEKITHDREWLSSADTVIAYSGSCGEKAEWKLSQSGVLTVSGSGTVKDIGKNVDSNIFTNVKDIIIENGITEISKGAFDKIKKSDCIIISESVTKIGSDNFHDVKYVKIPATVKRIGKNAFSARKNTSEDSRVCTAYLTGGEEQEKRYDKDFFAGNVRTVYSPDKLIVSAQVDYENCVHSFNWKSSDLRTAWVYLDGTAVEYIPEDAYKIKLTNAYINGIQNKRTDINSIAFKESTIYSLDFTDFGKTFECVSFIDSRIRLSGLNGVVSTQELYLSNMYFDDFEWLAHFKNTENIYIDSCSFGSTAGLEKLDKAVNLSIVNCFLENLEFVRGLKNLKSLDLTGTFVGNASGLAGSNLAQLNFYIAPSPFLNLSCLKQLPKLSTLLLDSFELGIDKDLQSYFKNRMKTNSKEDGYVSPGYYDDSEEYPESAKPQVTKILNSITSKSMAEEKKLESIVDYVIDLLDYDYNGISGLSENDSGDYNSHLLYYALQGIGVCANYAALTAALLNAAGIEAYYTVSIDHAWVCLKLGDSYYWLDPTNLDRPGYYFEFDIALTKVEYMLNFHGNVPLAIPPKVYCTLAEIVQKPSFTGDHVKI